MHSNPDPKSDDGKLMVTASLLLFCSLYLSFSLSLAANGMDKHSQLTPFPFYYCSFFWFFWLLVELLLLLLVLLLRR